MKAEIISIGSELTSGHNLDTNAQWLSLRLEEIGIPVGWHTTIADNLEDNVAAFRIAAQRAGVVIATGGLGPTQDDLTREVLAQVVGADLVFDQASFDRIAAMFAGRGRAMPERNRVQALFPAGAEPIVNARGTAPGIWLRFGAAVIACLPGVPSEMFAMFETEVKPRLLTMSSGGVRVQRKLNTFGGGESHIESKLMDLTRRDHVPEVGITAGDATISLRIFAHAATRAEAQAQIAPVEATIRERLGTLVFGVDDEELQDVLIRLLADNHLTLATAESMTGGLVAQRLSQVSGARRVFWGGVVAYDARLKVALLGVPQEVIDAHGVISAEVARAMAIGCRTRLHTDLAVSTVGLAGPGGGTAEKPVGLAYVGLAWNGGASTASFSWSGTRREIQSRTAKLALSCVRLHLLEKRA